MYQVQFHDNKKQRPSKQNRIDSKIKREKILSDESSTLLASDQYSDQFTSFNKFSSPSSIIVYKEQCYWYSFILFSIQSIRFIILILFSLSTAAVGIMWDTVSPIASILHQVKMALYITLTVRNNTQATLFYITFVIFNFPFVYLIERKGIKFSLIIALFFTTIGFWMRLALIQSPYIAVAGQSLGGVFNVVFSSLPTSISLVWFKNQSVSKQHAQYLRTMATTITSVANILGNAVGQIIPTLIVKDGDQYKSSQVTQLMIVQAGYATFVIVLVIVFFKAKPKYPPSLSAQQSASSSIHKSFGKSLKAIFCNCNFLVLMFTFFCVNGALNGITSVLQEILKFYSYQNAEVFSSKIGCLLFLVGFLGSLGFAFVADKTKKFKLLLFVSSLLSTATLLAFTYLVQLENKWLTGSIVCLFGFFNITSMPLALQLGAQIVYPIGIQIQLLGQTISTGVLMASSQISGVALVYISSALFDSKNWGLSNFDKAKIVNLINMAICAVGTVICLFIKCKSCQDIIKCNQPNMSYILETLKRSQGESDKKSFIPNGML